MPDDDVMAVLVLHHDVEHLEAGPNDVGEGAKGRDRARQIRREIHAPRLAAIPPRA